MKAAITPPRKGEPITARFLGEVADRLRGDINAPDQEGAGVESDVTPQQVEEWKAVTWTTTTVRVTDPDDEDTFVDVERFETVTFLAPGNRFVKLVLPEL